jgi:hypothetical protein
MPFVLVRTAAILAAVTWGACSSDDGPAAPTLNLRQVSVTPTPPAKVQLFFTVDTAAGAPITDLTNAEVALKEDGNRLSATDSKQRLLKSPPSFRAYTALVLDLSGSIIRGDTLPAVQAAATEFARSLTTAGLEHYVGVFTFDGRAKLTMVQPFTNVTSTLEGAIAGISTRQCDTTTPTPCTMPDHSDCVEGSGTGLCIDDSANLYGAIVEGLTTLDKALADATSVQFKIGSMVLFTDGIDQTGTVSRDAAVDKANRSANFIYTIGFGTETDNAFLGIIGQDGTTPVAASAGLNTAFVAVTDKIKLQTGRYYLLEYCSPKRGGRHEVTVTATRNVDGAIGVMTATFSADGFTSGCTLQ